MATSTTPPLAAAEIAALYSAPSSLSEGVSAPASRRAVKIAKPFCHSPARSHAAIADDHENAFGVREVSPCSGGRGGAV